MKLNPDKCHLLISSSEKVNTCEDDYNIKIRKYEIF